MSDLGEFARNEQEGHGGAGGPSAEKRLSVIVTVVSGPDSLRECVGALVPQMDEELDELIVPFDEWSLDAADLAGEFPGIRLVKIEDAGIAGSLKVAAREHRLYDRRRAIGLASARGELIAMTEDHAIPSADWCSHILEVHSGPAGAIGGVIDNRVDRALNWAQYYCDFGRYGPPLRSGSAAFVSDVNVSYKRSAINSVRDAWELAYRETEVHDEISRRGLGLELDGRLVVYQNRPRVSLGKALKERMEWGRVYGEIRSGTLSGASRLAYAAGTVLLPFVLVSRVIANIGRQKRPSRHYFTVVPLAFLLLVFWSFGEMKGYIAGDGTAREYRERDAEAGDEPTAA